MKSQSNVLLQIALGVLKDFQVAYPECRGVERDKARLASLVKNRGIGVFGLDLPNMLDGLLHGLEHGRLTVSGTVRYSKRYPVPRLFAGLYMRIFDEDLCLKQDPCINAISFLIQLLRLGKKIEVECTQERTIKVVEEYYDVERKLLAPTLRWAQDEFDPIGVGRNLHLSNLMVSDLPLFPRQRSLEEDRRIKDLLNKCQLTADLVVESIGQFEPYSFCEERAEESRAPGFKHGPGAVAERSGRYFDKNDFPNWPAKLHAWFPFDEFGKMPNDPKPRPRNHEVASRLIAVPKTMKGPRLIAAEPTEHQFCQQQLLSFFKSRFRSCFKGAFITLNDQKPSQEMTLRASLDRSLATVDLSSASDRLSCYVVERVLRRSQTLLHALHAARTRSCRDSITHKGETMLLRKFASQGTAVTFPVQSLVFLICALSVSMDGRPTWAKINKLRDKVRVFGDDIILPSTRYADLVDLLTTLQLKVNQDKSFVRGHFRESCGMYAYAGHDVTPVSPKTTIPESAASRKACLDIYNNLFYKGYWNASANLESTDGMSSFIRRLPVVGRDAASDGRRSFQDVQVLYETCMPPVKWRTDADSHPGRNLLGYLQPTERAELQVPRVRSHRNASISAQRIPLRIRWNARLHRQEVFVWTVRSRQKVRPCHDGYSALLQFSIAEQDTRGNIATPRVSGVAERPSTVECRRWESLASLWS